MPNDSQEFENKPSSNKDLWLFLIVLDVIFLCVFGFFLYKHFSGQLLNPAPAQPVHTESQTQDTLPKVEEETTVTVTEEIPVVVVDEPSSQPMPETTPVAEPAPVVKEMAPVVEEQPAKSAPKESIIVTATNGKYRRVTFRWFEPAETVSIVSGFTNRKPQALKKVGDYWETTLSIAPGTYKFLYVIDGKNTPDPYAEQKDGRSVLVVK